MREFRDDVNQEYMGRPCGHADLYGPFTDEIQWDEAERFTGVGVPFDCIDVRLTAGPRGGIVQERG